MKRYGTKKIYRYFNVKYIKKIALLIMILALAISVVGCNSKDKGTFQNYVDSINDNYKAKIYIYGDDINFGYDLKYTKIDSLNECKSYAQYKFIIINFDKSEFSLTQDDLTSLASFEKENYKILYDNFTNYATFIINSGYDIIDTNNNRDGYEEYLVDYQTHTTFKSQNESSTMVISLIARCLSTYSE